METPSVPTIAGAVSTAIFTLSSLPMLGKALRTRDLASYSPANLALATVGNAVHWLYVAGLPLGPIWVLHAFHTVSTLLMLVWYLRYRCTGRNRPARDEATAGDTAR